MHYYPHHIGDYRSSTSHLSNEEDLTYRRLLEMYYDSEQPIPLETNWVARRLRVGCESVVAVLNDFFEKRENGWYHAKCEKIIKKYQSQAETARENGKKGGRRKACDSNDKNPVGSKLEPISNQTITQPLANQEPVTNNQEPILKTTTHTHVRPENVDNYPQSKPQRFYLKSDWVVEKTDQRVVSAARLINIAVDDIADHAFNQALLAFRGMSAQREFNDELAAINVFCAKYLKTALLNTSKTQIEQPKRELTREERRAEQDKKYEHDEVNFNRKRWNKNNQDDQNV